MRLRSVSNPTAFQATTAQLKAQLTRREEATRITEKRELKLTQLLKRSMEENAVRNQLRMMQ